MNLCRQPLCTLGFLALALFQSTPGAQSFEPGDSVMGDYEGTWDSQDGRKGRAISQVRALADNAYDGFVRFERERKVVSVFRIVTLDPKSSGPINLSGTSLADRKGGELMPRIDTKAQIRDGKMTGTFSGDFGSGTFEAKRYHKTSPAEGAEHPAGALVIFDGKDTSQWKDFHWKLVADGAMEAQQGNLTTKDRLPDYRLHLEFRVPFLPRELGQGRGNSGVFLQSLYEVQILDSFGVYPPQPGDCAGLFGFRESHQNACLPPGRWQTFDITYREAKEQGQIHPTATVIHNGVVVLDRVRIPAALVAKGTGGGDPQGGFLMLQDHNHPVQFRNIWVLPLTPQ